MLLEKLFYFEKPIDIIIALFTVFYLIVCNFEITVFRAVFTVLLSIVFKWLKMRFTRLDILSMIGILMLLFEPRYLFLLSFELSFLVSFVIIIFVKNIKISNKIFSTYLVSFIAFLVTLPFILNVNYEINLLAILIGPLYVLYFELLLYPVTIIMFLVPQLSFLFDYVFMFFEVTIIFFDNIKMFNLVFGMISEFSFIIYEILLFFLFASYEVKRGRMLLTVALSLFLIVIYHKNWFNPFYQIKMYDVGQGDSILISLPHGQGNILFDCYNDIDKHLKKDGIRHLDIIFISHGHSDHMGAYTKIQQELSVGYTYSSYYDDSKLLKELEEKYEIILIKSGDLISFKNILFNILGPIKHYKNENDNSLVVKAVFDDISILLTGDIENQAEQDLVYRYKEELKSDILKVAHHGSLTSSSKEFLKYVSAKYLLISVGRNNKYNFPNNNYLLSFNNIYRTDIDYSITIYKRKKIFYIK